VPQSNRMLAPILLLALLPGAVQTPSDEDFKVYTEAPRLFLNARRLRLLRRERERESMRWQHYQTLMEGKALMPEPGLANALYFMIKSDPAYAKAAVDWALGTGADLRQQAIVFDWCAKAVPAAQSDALAARLEKGIAQSAGKTDIKTVSARVLAAAALAERKPDLTENTMRTAVVEWWRGYVVPSIQKGEPVIHRDDVLSLFEFLHAVRDNTNIELRDPVPAFFHDLPSYLLLSYYPAPYPAPENEYRIPVFYEDGDPDLHRAALARAGEFVMVAYDNNAVESQFLQGWLMQDRYLMKSPLGSVYEMLWANPYQPGLSYFHLPLVFRDEKRRGGALALRSNWDETAVLFTYIEGKAQVFDNGARKLADLKKLDPPLHIADAAVTSRLSFEADSQVYFVLGLTPGAPYEVEVDDEGMFEELADAGGVLLLKLQPGAGQVRIHPPTGLGPTR
jgi:hypothetical protein